MSTPEGPDVTVNIRTNADGHPTEARATTLVNASPERVWSVIEAVEGYPTWVPMIHRVRLEGETVHVQLKFRLALFSVGFDFHATATREPARRLELAYLRGEPRDIRLKFDLEPVDAGAKTRLTTTASFDAFSLGWLVKAFLKHHPEIRYGIFPGVALTLCQELKRAVESRTA